MRDNTPITAFADSEYQPKEQYYYTDAISDNASRFIAEHKKRAGDKPFFMYVAFTAAHWPMHARERDIAKYKGKYDQGYEPIRRARREKAIKLGLIDPAWSMAPHAGDWDKVANKDWEARGMEVYAAMIDAMDQGVGRIIAELKRQGQFDNTVIFFLQDNGGCAEPMGRPAQGPNAPTQFTARPDKPAFEPLAKDAQHYFASIPKQTRDGWPVIMGPGVMPGSADTFIAYGQGWANVSNTCASPKLRLACIFNNFIKLLAARGGDVVRRLPRSRLPLPNPAAASLSAPAHPYTKINVFWNGDSKRCNFS